MFHHRCVKGPFHRKRVWNPATFHISILLRNQCNICIIYFSSQADLRSLCKKTSWPERRIQTWFRRRRNQERPGLCKRFCEARCVCLSAHRTLTCLQGFICSCVFLVCQQLEMRVLLFCICWGSLCPLWCKWFGPFSVFYWKNFCRIRLLFQRIFPLHKLFALLLQDFSPSSSLFWVYNS